MIFGKKSWWDFVHSDLGKWKKAKVIATNHKTENSISLQEYKELMGPCRFCGTKDDYDYVTLYPKKLKQGFVKDNLQPVCTDCIKARAKFRNYISRKRNIDLEK